MKITTFLTVEVDPATWTTTYGVEGAKDIREDVRSYVRGLVNDSAAAEECGLKVVRG